jgi:hypothetical protein
LCEAYRRRWRGHRGRRSCGRCQREAGEHPHPCRKLGRHVHYGFAGCGQPPRQVPTETTGVLHRLGRRSGNLLAQRSRALNPARSCGKEARSSSSPVASSTAATANATPCGDRLRSGPSWAPTSVSVGPLLLLRRARRTFLLLRALLLPYLF